MYGGTKAELERLIKDAASYTDIQKQMGITVDASSMSFDNIVNAIAVVQGKLGIAGATAEEASTTIEGSVNSMKAAWQNFLTSLADENADYQYELDILMDSVKTVAKNVYPVVEQALWSIGDMVEDVLPEIVERIPQIISEVIPKITKIAVKLIEGMVDGISQSQSSLVNSAFQIITYLANSMITMLPKIVQLGLDLIVSLADGISQNVDELLPTIFDVVGKIITMIIENAPRLAEAAFGIIDALGNSLAEEIPGLSWVFENLETAVIAVTAAMVAYKAATAISGVIDALRKATEGQTLAQILLNTVMNANPFVLVATLIAGLVAAVITLWHTNDDFKNALISAWDAIKNAAVVVWESIVKFFTEDIPNAFNAVINFVKDNWQSLLLFITNPIAGALKLLYDLNPKFKEWVDGLLDKINKWTGGMVDIGKNIVAGLKKGVQNAWNSLVRWFKGLFGDLIGIAKKILGIASPSKVFKKIGGFTAEGFGAGFEDEFAHVKDDMEDALNFDDASVGINASIRKVGEGAAGGAFGGTSIGNININIDGAKYSDEQSLASAIAQEIQNMTDRRAAVYA